MTLKTVTTHTAFTTIITLMKLKALATPLFPCIQKMTTYVFGQGLCCCEPGKVEPKHCHPVHGDGSSGPAGPHRCLPAHQGDQPDRASIRQ